MYSQSRNLGDPNRLVCPDCQGTGFRVDYKKVICTNCGWEFKRGGINKYGAIRTQARDGRTRDSKFEAGVADELFLRRTTGDILDYDSQFKVEIWCYREDGTKAFKVSHKIDFRIHHNDGSFELVEAKGIETSDYKWRRKFLEEIWLPGHKDHTYTVVKQ